LWRAAYTATIGIVPSRPCFVDLVGTMPDLAFLGVFHAAAFVQFHCQHCTELLLQNRFIVFRAIYPTFGVGLASAVVMAAVA